jgi:hypothetical protein
MWPELILHRPNLFCSCLAGGLGLADAESLTGCGCTWPVTPSSDMGMLDRSTMT